MNKESAKTRIKIRLSKMARVLKDGEGLDFTQLYKDIDNIIDKIDIEDDNVQRKGKMPVLRKASNVETQVR